jgi:dimethylhistidine N-methyltransferase
MSFFSETVDNQLWEQLSFQERWQIEFLDHKQILLEKDDQDVISGLTKPQKSLPPHYFYDSKGSQLFEEICQLPEYYPTRTEAQILQQYAQEIARITEVCELIELGSGSSTKTRLLLDAYSSFNYPLRYIPIDISGSILKESAYNLLKDYPQLHIYGKVGTYEQALTQHHDWKAIENLGIPHGQLQPGYFPQKMVVFLGSTIGNFNSQECDRFLDIVKSALSIGDYFLLGIDLQKPPEILEAAYNDSQGITAAFNLNMLQHLNWRFEGNFDLNLFTHRAIYNHSAAQIEMYLISNQSHSVYLKNLDLTVKFPEGETILTEISRKFNLQQMKTYLTSKKLKAIASYTDPNQWFALILCQVT